MDESSRESRDDLNDQRDSLTDREVTQRREREGKQEERAERET